MTKEEEKPNAIKPEKYHASAATCRYSVHKIYISSNLRKNVLQLTTVHGWYF